MIRRNRSRLTKYFFILSSIIIFLYIYIKFNNPHKHPHIDHPTSLGATNFYLELLSLYLTYNTSDTRACVLPDFDPFDASILRFIHNVSDIDCGHVQYALTYVDTERWLRVNLSAVREAGLNASELLCEYQEIRRMNEDDSYVILADPQEIPLDKGTLVECEFLVAFCYNTSDHVVHETVHALLKPLPEELANKSKRAHEEGAINVVIMVLDSMSRLNFERNMPATKQTLERFNATVLRGLNKVGENTLPNILALLTGLVSTSRGSEPEQIGPYINIDGRTHFDDIPAIWKNFSKKGHVTLFSEDEPNLTIFTYSFKGFKDPPTDYYMRPAWIAMRELEDLVSPDDRCWRHVPKHEFLWNYTENFIQEMHRSGNAYFVFSFSTGVAHSNINNVKVVDDDVAAMIARLHASGALNDTLFILMGDHGNRIDLIRQTVIGSAEDRMPLCAIILPEKLQHLRANLAENAAVLTSWHDVYETLMDVVTDNLAAESKVTRHGYHGSSLLRVINKDRTCRDVGVPTEYCVCNVEHDIHVSSAHAHTAAQVIVDHVNKILVEKNLTSICAEFQLNSILHARFSVVHKFGREHEAEIQVKLAVRAGPGDASFEAILRVSFFNIDIIGEVNRINKYGEHSACVRDKMYQKYCFCKE